jgi:signal transduction histidine kinase
MRVTGNPAWLTKEDWGDFLEYERTLEQQLISDRMIALCSYPLSTSSAAEILEMVNCHHFALIRRGGEWEIVESSELKEAKEQLKRYNEQLRALSARLESAREQESIRIARKIKDQLGPVLASLRWELEDIEEVISEATDLSQRSGLRERIAGLIGLTDGTMNSMKRIAAELRPMALDELGLIEAVQWHARQFQDRTGITVKLDSPLEGNVLSGVQANAVFRIFEEALTNVKRHSQATQVEIALGRDGDEFVLVVRDNGKGIDKRKKSATPSLGLLRMRERAHCIGAAMSIGCSEGQGTEITLRVPVRAGGRGEYLPSPEQDK